MAANYVLLERVTVGAAGAASVTFSNIPQTGYTDLKIVGSVRNDFGAANTITAKFNGSATGFTQRYLEGSGTGVASGTNTTWIASSGDSANIFSNWEVYIPNYTSSNYKSWSTDSVTELNGNPAYATFIAGLWSNTAAITSVGFFQTGGNFRQYSTFSLYGLAAVGTTPVIAPYASGGDIIQTDGTYWYHAFLGSGAFTPAKTLSCDVLVVAGGGGGGSTLGGGGGAGGLLTFTSQNIAAAAQTITVGAGGAGAPNSTTKGASGSNSQFASLTASVGGGGGGTYLSPGTGITGGSGGGSSWYNLNAPGSGTSGQGYAGGTAQTDGSTYRIGGGGGGAGGVGADGSASSYSGGNGGVGMTSTLINSMALTTGTGQLVSTNYYYAGGGGGARNGGATATPGGSGGGGTGVYTPSGTATVGIANTGGGGGAGWDNPGAAGGSGIVIIRYAI